jgi:aromatic ring-opening dioxygenase catalytic subunit (LigB family)
MGASVGAGLLSHVPSIMLPEAEQKSRYGGRDSTFPRALQDIFREHIQSADIDTFLIFDTHWYTTRGFVVNTYEHLKGVYTSDELPSVIHDLVFDYRGDKALGEPLCSQPRTWDYDVRAQTIRHGPALPDAQSHAIPESGASIPSTVDWRLPDCTHERHLDFGAAIGHAIQESDRRVIILAAGGLSHQFWSYDEMVQHSPRTLNISSTRPIEPMTR